MAQQTRTTLKTYFETGDTPTQAQFIDLIDSSPNPTDDGTTGTGSYVRATSPTLVTPALGTPSALVATNATGTAAGLTAGTVTTNANLTGPVTSTGNATAIADAALSIAKTSGLQAALDAKAPSTAPTFATSVTGSYLTASELLGTGASKEIVSLPVATYPSLAELAHVKGVTSAIQTQLNAKAAALGADDNYVTDAEKAALHAAVTVADSSEIDLTLTGQQISAALVAGSIDETKLDASVNASLDLADSALQAASISDTAYDATSWNGVTTIAPSKNAVRDKIESLGAPEGTAILSTGEVGGSKFLREDGDGTSSWQAISGGGDALTSSPLSQFAATTSLQLKGVISDETGSGALVFADSPVFTTAVTLPVALTGVIRADSGVVSVDTDVTDIVAAGTTTAAGKLELATDAEMTTGTDTARAITPANAKVELDKKLALAGGTMTGNITLGENTSLDLDTAGSADGKYTGIAITGTAGEALAFGDVIVLDVTAGKWFKGSVSAAAAADGDLRGGVGMCVLAAAGDASATKVLLMGTCRADANFPALTIGSVVYATTLGDITVTRPSTTDHVIKVLGYALTADEIYFCPSMDYMTNV